MIKLSESDQKLFHFIEYPNEERNLEFKESIPWDRKENSVNLIKAILALSNLKDGGWIVIGKKELPDGSYVLTGMIPSDFETYDSDQMKDFVNNRYADPYVTFSLHKVEYKGEKFMLIKVEEFEEVPVICKRDYSDILYKGRIYCRSRTKPESIAVPSQVEMREILEIATDKRALRFLQRIERFGMKLTPTDEELFNKQLEDLE